MSRSHPRVLADRPGLRQPADHAVQLQKRHLHADLTGGQGAQLREGVVMCGDERAAILRRFYHQHAQTLAGDNPVAQAQKQYTVHHIVVAESPW